MAELRIGRMVVSMCETNCYYIYREEEGTEGESPALVIDPGDRGGQIFEGLKQKGLRVEAILLTHGHFDHIWGVSELKRCSGAPVIAFEGERDVCEDSHANVSDQAGRPETVKADRYEKDGSILKLAGFTLRLIATPGHTHGSCCYYLEEERVLFSGDTLFAGSVGRTDFPTGSMSSLVRSVKEKLFILPEDVTVYPGHGEETSIGEEKRYNPYCQ